MDRVPDEPAPAPPPPPPAEEPPAVPMQSDPAWTDDLVKDAGHDAETRDR